VASINCVELQPAFNNEVSVLPEPAGGIGPIVWKKSKTKARDRSTGKYGLGRR